MKFHAYARRTLENALGFEYGMDRDAYYEQERIVNQSKSDPSIKVPVKEPFWEYFKQQGYVTGYSSNLCDSNIIIGDSYLEKLVKNTPRDHDGTSISCDPHLIDPVVGSSDWEGPFAHTPRCIYGQGSYTYTLDYTREFFEAYGNERSMFLLNFMDFHEGTYTVAKNLDKPLAAFLSEMVAKDITIVLFADHGGHLGGLKSHIGFTQRPIENFNPLLYVHNLKGLTSQQACNLKTNQQKLVTMVDLYHFFKFLASGKEDQPTIVSEMRSDEETCNMLGKQCLCTNYPINKDKSGDIYCPSYNWDGELY